MKAFKISPESYIIVSLTFLIGFFYPSSLNVAHSLPFLIPVSLLALVFLKYGFQELIETSSNRIRLHKIFEVAWRIIFGFIVPLMIVYFTYEHVLSSYQEFISEYGWWHSYFAMSFGWAMSGLLIFLYFVSEGLSAKFDSKTPETAWNITMWFLIPAILTSLIFPLEDCSASTGFCISSGAVFMLLVLPWLLAHFSAVLTASYIKKNKNNELISKSIFVLFTGLTVWLLCILMYYFLN